jgi:AraC family transcriptional regulator
MRASPLLRVRKELGKTPIVEGEIAGPIPLFVERYLYRAVELAVSGVPNDAVVILFGGSATREGAAGQERTTVLPTQSMLLPRNTATHWYYSGTVDYAVFYLLDTTHPAAQALHLLAESRNAPMRFSDQLVGAAGRQILDEMQKGPGADAGFIELLARVLCEQAYRVLTTPAAGGINPRHVHFSRLQAVLNHVRANLTGDLSVSHLAKLAGVDVSHFRRIFHDATGRAPHDYVVAARLEQARKLLAMSELPIVQIAEDCGFANQSHLTARFRAAHAVTPAQFRKKAGRA